MAKAAAKKARSKYVNPANGFALFKPTTAFSFKGADKAVSGDVPAVTVTSKKGDHQLVVLVMPPLSPQLQQVLTVKMAEQLAASLEEGKVAKPIPMQRPDKRVCYQVPFAGGDNQGVVCSVAAGKKIFLSISGFPRGAPTRTAEDLLFVQFALLVC